MGLAVGGGVGWERLSLEMLEIGEWGWVGGVGVAIVSSIVSLIFLVFVFFHHPRAQASVSSLRVLELSLPYRTLPYC